MRFVHRMMSSTYIFGLLVVASLLIYLVCSPFTIPNPPGWQESHDRVKSGPTPEQTSAYMLDGRADPAIEPAD